MMASGEAPGRAGARMSDIASMPAGSTQYKLILSANKAGSNDNAGHAARVQPSGSAISGSEARPTRRPSATAAWATRRGLRLHRQQALALHALAGKLTGAANRFRLLPGLLLGWLFVMAAKLHLTEDPLALHLFLQRLEGLIDVIVPDENLHAAYLFR